MTSSAPRPSAPRSSPAPSLAASGSRRRAPLGWLCLAGLSLASPEPASAGDEEVRARLQLELAEILRAPQLRNALAGVSVRRMEDGQPLFEHNADKLFNPASNMKILTTGAALRRLGPSYRFRTLVRRDREVRDGVVRGHLYLEARGDPTLTTENLFGLANEVALAGVRGVEGDLVVDDSFFDGVSEGPGWEQEVGDHSYNAPIGAFSVNFNTFEARVVPGDAPGATARLLLWPPVPSLVGEVSAATRGAGTRTRLWFGASRTPGDGVEVTVRGGIAVDDVGGRVHRRRVYAPTQFAAETFLHVLGLRGVKVKGRVRRGRAELRATELVAIRYSSPLAEIASTLNKYSNNFIAEQLLKTLAAEVAGPPGTWEKGQAALEAFMVSAGLPSGGFVLGNGSGLNDVNRVTPSQMTQVLWSLYGDHRVAPEFVASLAVAGSSGTIHGRFENSAAAERLRAKTGSLTGVSALSGYVVTQDGETWAFSIMMNDYEGRARAMWDVQDRIGIALARFSARPAVAAAAGARAEAEAPPAAGPR